MSAPTGWRTARKLTVTEAARALGVSRSLAYEWVESGRLAATLPINGRRWVYPAEVERLLAEMDDHQPTLFAGTGES